VSERGDANSTMPASGSWFGRTSRGVGPAGVVLAALGLVTAMLSMLSFATHQTPVVDLVLRGPLALAALGDAGSVVLLLESRRRRGRVFAALWGAGSAASVWIVRVRADGNVTGIDGFLAGSLAIAVGACLTLVPARRDR